jgi:hypothetical protein
MYKSVDHISVFYAAQVADVNSTNYSQLSVQQSIKNTLKTAQKMYLYITR